MAQVVECLPSKCKALSSNSRTKNERKKRKEKKKRKQPVLAAMPFDQLGYIDPR
jgi:hypothetical protein